MGQIEYTLSVALTSFYRAYQVGKRHPKAQRTFLDFHYPHVRFRRPAGVVPVSCRPCC